MRAHLSLLLLLPYHVRGAGLSNVSNVVVTEEKVGWKMLPEEEMAVAFGSAPCHNCSNSIPDLASLF